MAKRGSFTDSQDHRVQIERARRKNRRASITEQFVVPLVKSRRKEKAAQSRHHAFLLQNENLSAIHEIISRVEQIAESDPIALGHTLSPMDKRRLHTWANDVFTLLKEFEPSERHENDPLLQLLEMIRTLQEGHVCLAEVVIDARLIVESWERAGMFDDSRSSDEEDPECDQPPGTPLLDMRTPQQIAQARELEKRRKMESSYAYQRIRERAAARVIKHNTLTWVRSRAAFCSRVEELEVFGNTTAALVEELMTLSALQRRVAVSSASNTSDIFDLMKGKTLAGGRKIDFSDLMHFSKHLALFTVDHAIRRVEEIENKRRLFQLRCLIKLQTWWRKMHEVVKGRRMLKLLEEIRRKKEHERETEFSRVKEIKAKGITVTAKSGDFGGRKVSKTVAKNSKGVGLAVNVSGSANSSSRSIATPKLDGSEKAQAATKHSSRAVTAVKDPKSVMPTPPATPKSSTISGGGGSSRPKKSVVSTVKSDDKAERMARAARAREARLRKEFEEELQRRRLEDEEAERDTEDVEIAWKRFLESAQHAEDENGETAGDEGSERLLTASSQVTGRPASRGVTPLMAGDGDGDYPAEWREWSDDEDDRQQSEHDSHHSRGATPQTAASSRQSTPHVSSANPSQLASDNFEGSRPHASMKVVVTVKKKPSRQPTEEFPVSSAPTDESKPSSAESSTRSSHCVLPPYATAPSPARRQLLFGASQARLYRPAIPGTGQLSKCMPFADFEPPTDFFQSRRLAMTPPSAPVTPRRHLYEMDFHQTFPAGEADDRAALDMFLQDQPFFEDPLIPQDPMTSEIITPVVDTRASSVRVFPSIRATRVARVKAALQAKRVDQTQPQQPVVPTSLGGSEQFREVEPATLEQTDDSLIVAPTGSVATRSETVVVNTAVRDALLAPLCGRASLIAAFINNPMLKLDFRKEDIVRRVEETEETDTVVEELGAGDHDVAAVRRKFGSHAEWLKSMGLENAVAVAARGSTSSRQKNVRKLKTKDSQVTDKVISSIVMIQQTAATRASRKRRNEHSLPLLGKRGNDLSRDKILTSPKPMERIRPALPDVRDRGVRQPLRPREYTAISSQHPDTVVNKRPRRARNEPEWSSGSSGEDDIDDDEEDENESNSVSQSESEPLDEDDEEDNEVVTGGFTDEDGDGGTDGERAGGATEGIETTAAAPRYSSRRKMRSPRANNQRRRSSLYEPKHAGNRRKVKKIRRRKPDLADEGRKGDSSNEKAVTNEIKLIRGESTKRFRPRVPSLLERLLPKELRGSLNVATTIDLGDTIMDKSDRGQIHEDNCGSSDDQTVLEKDPAKVAAFQKLYLQYMGLLSAAPPSVALQ